MIKSAVHVQSHDIERYESPGTIKQKEELFSHNESPCSNDYYNSRQIVQKYISVKEVK